MELISTAVKGLPTPSQRRSRNIDNERWKLIRALIIQSFDACNLHIPEDKDLDFKTTTFYNDLEGVHTKNLTQVFAMARKMKSTSYPPSTGELWKAWTEIVKPQIEREAEIKEKKNTPRYLPKPQEPEMIAAFKRLPFLPIKERLQEMEKLHQKFPYAGWDKAINDEKNRLKLGSI